MQKHYKFFHLKERYRCAHCTKSFGHKEELTYHLDLDHPEMVDRPFNFPCPHPGCDLVFSLSTSLRQHNERIHIRKPQKKKPIPSKECPICHKMVQMLDTHMAIHERRARVSCDYCDKSFLQKHGLRDHVRRVHQGIASTIPCPVCGMSLSNKTALRKHIEGVHEGQRHQCPQCEKSYQSRNDLRAHILAAHQGIKKHCRFCALQFSRASDRNRHERKSHAEQLQAIENEKERKVIRIK